jgi:hypothetical protein
MCKCARSLQQLVKVNHPCLEGWRYPRSKINGYVFMRPDMPVAVASSVLDDEVL